MEVTFQLEEGEILGEPLPARDNRRAILAYEATEGGAGVLNRLVSEPQTIGIVARKALMLMHFEDVDKAILAGDASLLSSSKDAPCIKGCYRCLLSYFNQPDHELIDRTNQEAQQMLINLARGHVVLLTSPSRAIEVGSWEAAFKQAGLAPPDAASVTFSGQDMTFAWRSHFVAAHAGPLNSDAEAAAADKGWTVIALLGQPSDGLPEDLIRMLGQ